MTMAAKLFVCLVFNVGVMVGVSGFFVERHRNIIPGEETMDVSDFSIYYDMKTNQTIKNMMPRPWYKPGWLLRLPFTGGPCMCEGLQCICCTGIRIQTLNFDRQACTKLIYEPAESLLNMEVTMNGDQIYRNSFSARNPPPFCVPIVVPYLPPGLVDMCIRFFDIAVMDQRLHVCMDWDTRIDKAPVLILHFDCMDMGLNGVGLSKPSGSDQNTAITEMPTSSPEDAQIDSDVFDPVVEQVPVTVYPFNNTRKYI